MKVIIAGGREYQLNYSDWKVIEALNETYDFEWVFSGCATGADEAGEEYAEYHSLYLRKFPADWKQYGSAAGPIRNKEMAKEADAVILFPGGKGTASMRKLAKEHGLKILYDAG